MRSRKVSMLAMVLAGAAFAAAARAQTAPTVINGAALPPMAANERQAYLVRQDQSDCSNSNVPAGDSPNVSGNLWLSRGNDGNTTVKIAMTVSPNTTYHFYLKCVRQLGDIKTGEEGAGFATFSFPTNSVGATFAFDMYPEGAPAGNKFQSVTVNF